MLIRYLIRINALRLNLHYGISDICLNLVEIALEFIPSARHLINNNQPLDLNRCVVLLSERTDALSFTYVDTPNDVFHEL